MTVSHQRRRVFRSRSLWAAATVVLLLSGIVLGLWAAEPKTAAFGGERAVLAPDWPGVQQASGLYDAKRQLAVTPHPEPPYTTPLQNEQAGEYLHRLSQLELAYAAACGQWAELVGRMESDAALRRDDRRLYLASRTGASASEPQLFELMTTDAPELLVGVRFLESGGDECVVSRGVAEAYGLSVGSTLPMRVFPAEILWDNGGGLTLSESWSAVPSSTESLTEKTYTVAGIYEPSGTAPDEYGLPPDAVLVPSASLSGLPQAGVRGNAPNRLPGALSSFLSDGKSAGRFLSSLSEEERQAFRVNGERPGDGAGIEPVRIALLLGAAAVWLSAAVFAAVKTVHAFTRPSQRVKAASRREREDGSRRGAAAAVFACWRKSLFRRPAQPLLFLLLLALSGALVCTGAGLLHTAGVKSGEASDAYDTVLTVSIQAVQTDSGLTKDVAAYRYDFVKTQPAQQRYQQLLALAQEAGTQLTNARADDRRHYAAVFDGLHPVTTWRLNPEGHDPYQDGELLSGIFGAVCHSVIHNEAMELRDESSDYISIVWKTEAVPAANPLLEIPEYMVSTVILPRQDAPVELREGERYLLNGYAVQPGYYEFQQGYAELTPDASVPGLLLFGSAPTKAPQAEVLFYLSAVLDGQTPYIEATGGLTAAEFLKTPRGAVWLTAVGTAQKRADSLYLMTTDDLNSVPTFHRGETQLVLGRGFTAAEYSGGAHVCLVSEGVAAQNGLHVGDSISAELFPTGYLREMGGEIGRDPLLYDWFYAEQRYTAPLGRESFEIVGIYGNPGWGRGEQELSLNTVFVPASALAQYPPMPESHYGAPQRDYALLVANDDIGRLEAELAANTFGRYFRLDDQGYRQAAEIIGNATKYAAALFVLAAAVWLIVAALFLQGYVRKKRETAVVLRAFGAGKGSVFAAQLVNCGLVIALSGLLAGLASSLSMQAATEAIHKLARLGAEITDAGQAAALSSGAVSSGAAIALTAAVQALGVLAAAAVTAWKNTSRKSLMRRSGQE